MVIKETYFINLNKYRKSESLKYHIFHKTLVYPIISNKCGSKDEKIFKEGKLIQMLKILGFIKNIEEYEMNI